MIQYKFQHSSSSCGKHYDFLLRAILKLQLQLFRYFWKKRWLRDVVVTLSNHNTEFMQSILFYIPRQITSEFSKSDERAIVYHLLPKLHLALYRNKDRSISVRTKSIFPKFTTSEAVFFSFIPQRLNTSRQYYPQLFQRKTMLNSHLPNWHILYTICQNYAFFINFCSIIKQKSNDTVGEIQPLIS